MSPNVTSRKSLSFPTHVKTYSASFAAAKDAEYVFTCVGNDNDLREVTFGDNGAFKTIKKGATYIDNTTASATIAREIYEHAKKNGFGALDAPVSGGQACPPDTGASNAPNPFFFACS